MRLLNTQTKVLEEFLDPPPYAILSHRWSATHEELSFEDYNLVIGVDSGLEPPFYAKRADLIRQKPGFRKIVNFCDYAQNHGHHGPAGRFPQMWDYYEQADTCYVFLADVPPLFTGESEVRQALANSKWFTRGWTLQELLAPWYVRFFTLAWEEFGHVSRMPDLKNNLEFVQEISRISQIPCQHLEINHRFTTATVAEKMSWAAHRTTSRKEDRAYSLFGLFGVNLTPMYGEGDEAFVRLQEEIYRQKLDASMFTWNVHGTYSIWRQGLQSGHGGFLARRPECYRRSGTYLQLRSDYRAKGFKETEIVPRALSASYLRQTHAANNVV